MEEIINKKRKLKLISGILLTVIILIGSTYAFFTYYKSIQAFTLTSNAISATFTSGTHSVTFSNAYPISDEFAIQNLDNLTYIDFTVSGNTENEEEAIAYEIFLTEKTGNTLSNEFVKAYLTDQTNVKVTEPKTIGSMENTTYSKEPSGKVVYKEIKEGSFTRNFRLYVWLDKDYEQNTTSQTYTFYVNIYAYNDTNHNGAYLLNKKIEQLKEENPSCNYVVKEYKDANNEQLEATYLSGPKTGDCAIDFNYVWYSGKMWRITAIYPDGKMKLVTDNNITIIAFNESGNVSYYNKSTGAKSWMFQWLNEDFLDTLYNYENIIVHDANTYWNATMPSTTDISTKPTETDATMIPTSISPVGLLNNYEYYLSFKINGINSFGNGYLNIGYHWWLLNPYSSSYVRTVSGNGFSKDSPISPRSTRPSVILKSNISFTGSGIKTDPYKIVGDLSSPTLGTTKVNERIFQRTIEGNNITCSYNGEYVKIKYNNELSPLYRIVGVEEDPNDNTKKITKLVAMDYVKENDTNKTLAFATSSAGVLYGSGTTVDSNKTTWYSYLNGTGNNDGWFDSLSYKSLLTSGRYYMGNGDTSSKYNYKGAICATADITGLTRTCTKTSNAGTFNVGLPRYGEMFATQQKTSTNTSSITMWLITKYGTSGLRYVDSGCNSADNFPTNAYGARPTIHLSSDVKFLTCSQTKCDGTEDYPYEVGL